MGTIQNFTQKDVTEVKIFQKVLAGGGYFFETPGRIISVTVLYNTIRTNVT